MEQPQGTVDWHRSGPNRPHVGQAQYAHAGHQVAGQSRAQGKAPMERSPGEPRANNAAPKEVIGAGRNACDGSQGVQREERGAGDLACGEGPGHKVARTEPRAVGALAQGSAATSMSRALARGGKEHWRAVHQGRGALERVCFRWEGCSAVSAKRRRTQSLENESRAPCQRAIMAGKALLLLHAGVPGHLGN
jgi:hypothetical protein